MPRAPSTDSARQQVGTLIEHLQTLLRLLDPQTPFQPIVVGSIDLVAWLADFGTTAETLERALRTILAEQPRKSREPLRVATAALFSISDTVCDAPRLHHARPADYPPEELPGLEGLEPSSARSPEEQVILSDALAEAAALRDKATRHMALLSKSLDVSMAKLKTTLLGKHGLLRLMKHRSRRSSAFRKRFGDLTDRLTKSLDALPQSAAGPWSAHRRVLAQMDFMLAEELLPALDEILKTVITPETPGRSGKQSARPNSLRQTIKNATTRSVDAFREAYTLANNLDASLQAHQFWILFTNLLAPVVTLLTASGSLKPVDITPKDQRLIDALTRVDVQLLTKTVRTDWERLAGINDDYTLEIVVAALHQLERSDQAAFGFSEEQLARWIRKGTYPGAATYREKSSTPAAETKRVQRTLQKMRSLHAAFHDRRHWTPTLTKNSSSARHRLWTLNPLLASHPWVRERLASAPTQAGEGQSELPLPRTPSKRNRGPSKKR